MGATASEGLTVKDGTTI